MVNDFVIALSNIQSTVVNGILDSGIKENEITDENDYIVRREDENVSYKGNSIFAIFNEVYSPMRDYGGRPIGFNIHEENMLINDKLTNIQAVTLGEGVITLAVGSEQKMNKLLLNFRQLVNNDSFQKMVRESYKQGKKLFNSNEIQFK